MNMEIFSPMIFRSRGQAVPSFGTRIHYFIAYEDESANLGYLTPFRGFQFVPLFTSDILQVIATLPSDVRQFAYDANSSVNYRAVGLQHLRVAYCPVKHLSEVITHQQPQFCVVIFEEEFNETVTKQIQKLVGQTTLLVSFPVAEGGDWDLADIVPSLTEFLGKYVRGVVTSLASSEHEDIAAAFRSLAMADLPHRRAGAKLWEYTPIRSLLPSHTVLFTMGYDLNRGSELRSEENDPYFEAIARTAEEVLRQRATLFAAREGGPLIRTQNDILLVAPTAYGELRLETERASHWANAMNVPVSSPEFHQFIDILLRQNGFLFGGQMTQAEGDFLLSDNGKLLHSVYNAEWRAVMAYASLIAADSQAPALQWAPSISEAYRPLVDFARHYRDNYRVMMPILGDHAGDVDVEANRQAIRLFASCQDALSRVTPPQYFKLLRSPGSAKILADLPLEWLDVDGLPLMFARETSRLPVTPGLLLKSLPTPEPLFLPCETCHKVLILTGFDESRGNHSELVDMVQRSNFEVIKLEIKIVQKSKDVLNALKDFDGPLVIFDTHAGVAEDLLGEMGLSGGGAFSPNRELVTTSAGMWQRPFELHMPPLVVLSACDTLPIDSSSGSAAYGFLLGGAYAVLATFLPVLMSQGGLFVGRLLHRYDELLAMGGPSQPESWRQIVWDTQRLMYLSELFRIVEKNAGASFSAYPISDAYKKFSIETGTIINDESPKFPGGRRWFDHAITLLAETFSISQDKVLAILRDKAQFTDAMNYVHLGFPERVVIMTEGFEQLVPKISQYQWREAFSDGHIVN